MAQSAKADVENAADKAANNVAEISKRAADRTGEMAEIGKRAADKTSEMARHTADRVEESVEEGTQAAQRVAGATLEVGREVGRRSAEGAGEVNQLFAELANEQSRHGIETFRALTRTVDWREVAGIQTEFLRASIERSLAFSRRYFEMVQSVSFSALSTAEDQAGKVAAKR